MNLIYDLRFTIYDLGIVEFWFQYLLILPSDPKTYFINVADFKIVNPKS
jgi:hypothetical protein